MELENSIRETVLILSEKGSDYHEIVQLLETRILKRKLSYEEKVAIFELVQ